MRRFLYVVAPDFSIKIGMFVAEQIHNYWRNMSLAYWMQSNGISVIPLACWSDTMSFDWCFDGMPNGGTIAVSMTGAMVNGISPELREYSEIDRIDGIKVIKWDVGDNNRTPVYSNTPNTVYYSYSTTDGRIERILFYEEHRLVRSIDMEDDRHPAHAHKWSHAGMQVGRTAHSKKNIFELSREDLKFYKKAKKWNDEHRE